MLHPITAHWQAAAIAAAVYSVQHARWQGTNVHVRLRVAVFLCASCKMSKCLQVFSIVRVRLCAIGSMYACSGLCAGHQGLKYQLPTLMSWRTFVQ